MTADDDPVLSDHAVRAIVRRHADVAQAVVSVDESGRKARAYLVGKDIVLKTHRPQRLRGRVVEEFETSLEKEAFFLDQMTSDPWIPAPRLLGYGREDGVEYVCMTRIAGTSLRRGLPDAPQRHEVLRQVGMALRRIHSLPQAPFAASGLFPVAGASAELRTTLRHLLGSLVSAVEALPSEWQVDVPVRDIAANALAAMPDSQVRVALHSNPADEHLYFDPASGRLTGIIDFADAFIGHPAFDLRPWREPDDGAAVMEGYTYLGPVDEAFEATWRVARLTGELASILRRREPPARAEVRLSLLRDEIDRSG